MRFFEKFSKVHYTPLYPFEKGIKGYNALNQTSEAQMDALVAELCAE